MNYNNSASRICLPRLASPAPMKFVTKPTQKPFRKATRRRSMQAVAALLIAFALSDGELHAQTEHPTAKPAHASLLTVALPCAGLAVALWRVPLLFRRNLAC